MIINFEIQCKKDVQYRLQYLHIKIRTTTASLRGELKSKQGIHHQAPSASIENKFGSYKLFSLNHRDRFLLLSKERIKHQLVVTFAHNIPNICIHFIEYRQTTRQGSKRAYSYIIIITRATYIVIITSSIG